MQLPDLEHEVYLWKLAFRIPEWKIETRYVDNLKHPETNQPVWGLCTITHPDDRRALLQVCTPRNERELKEVLDTMCHEMAHVFLRDADIQILEEEEQVVWTLAPLLTHFRENAPELLADYIKSLPWSSPPSLARIAAKAVRAPVKALLAARVRARAGGKRMDPTLAKVLLALVDQSSMTDEEKAPIKAALEEIIADTSGAVETDETLVEEPVLGADKPVDEPKPPMGMKAEEFAKVKAKAEADAQEQAAKAYVEKLPLAPEQRTYAAKLKTLSAVEEYVNSLPKVVEQSKAKLGMPAPVRGGDSRTHFAKAQTPSPDAALNRMMRVFPKHGDGNFGIRVPDNKAAEGKLVEFSITDALPDIRSAVAKNAGMKEGA